ncbi:hypothetical protein PoB_006669600 [Plakobranchus ocellatus]|uniref:Uncharacterized protein n=1 Tax=Plakobranchus ocellatus TaxID=259542 RepID=A0AAV4D825_9GAST|nr:hypothetical protein PoB_006669600 [Plakobranchus ocellatus]
MTAELIVRELAPLFTQPVDLDSLIPSNTCLWGFPSPSIPIQASALEEFVPRKCHISIPETPTGGMLVQHYPNSAVSSAPKSLCVCVCVLLSDKISIRIGKKMEE